MKEILIAAAIAAAFPTLWWVYKTFVKPKLKQAFDDPKTPQDESDVFDPAAEAFIKWMVEFAKKNQKPVDPGAVAKDVVKRFPGVSLEAATKRVDKALGRK